jgi:hypothetical protein
MSLASDYTALTRSAAGLTAAHAPLSSLKKALEDAWEYGVVVQKDIDAGQGQPGQPEVWRTVRDQTLREIGKKLDVSVDDGVMHPAIPGLISALFAKAAQAGYQPGNGPHR